MSGPQLEDGFTRIAHEILLQTSRFSFNGSQLSLILVIWRFTYGFGRKDHDFSNSFLAELTGMAVRTVQKELSELIEQNVVIVTKEATNNTSRKLSFNKYYESWIVRKRGERVNKKDKLEVINQSPQQQCLEVINQSSLEVINQSPQTRSGGDQLVTQDIYKSFKDNLLIYNVTFDDFWNVYPRKISKPKAQSSWNALSKKKGFDPHLIVANTINFAETCKLLEKDKSYIPYPATYLNQMRYEDYETVDPEGLAAGKQSKFGSNLDFLKDQIGGERNEPGSSSGITGKSLSSLPEQGSRFPE